MKRRGVLLLLGAVLALAAAACAGHETEGGQASEPRDVVFMAGFRPQANLPFVAVYVADAQGFFEDEGLDVEILHSAGQDEHFKFVLEGTVDITTGTAAQVLRGRAQGLPLTAVALFGQRGDQGYIVRADDIVRRPEDLRGRTIGFKAGVVPAELQALLARGGLTGADVDLQAVGFDPRVFMEGGVDVYPVFLNNEPFVIRKAGVEIEVIDPHDFGVPTLGLTYVVREGALEDERDVLQRFLRATMRATYWARDHVDEAVRISLEWSDGADFEHQRFLLETDLRNAAQPRGIGRATATQWSDLADLLEAYDVIPAGADVASAFDGSLIEALYEDGVLSASR